MFLPSSTQQLYTVFFIYFTTNTFSIQHPFVHQQPLYYWILNSFVEEIETHLCNSSKHTIRLNFRFRTKETERHSIPHSIHLCYLHSINKQLVGSDFSFLKKVLHITLLSSYKYVQKKLFMSKAVRFTECLDHIDQEEIKKYENNNFKWLFRR